MGTLGRILIGFVSAPPVEVYRDDAGYHQDGQDVSDDLEWLQVHA